MAGSEVVMHDVGGAPSERELVAAAQADPRRFADLYELHFDRIYAYVASRVRDRAVAQDLTSEVFRGALESLPKYEWRGAPFSAWLYRIGSRVLADHFRQVARESRTPVTGDEPGEAAAVEADHDALLFRLVRQLPPRQRQVIELRFGEELSVSEVAERLGKTEAAIKQLQFRALETLRKWMGKANG